MINHLVFVMSHSKSQEIDIFDPGYTFHISFPCPRYEAIYEFSKTLKLDYILP